MAALGVLPSRAQDVGRLFAGGRDRLVSLPFRGGLGWGAARKSSSLRRGNRRGERVGDLFARGDPDPVL